MDPDIVEVSSTQITNVEVTNQNCYSVETSTDLPACSSIDTSNFVTSSQTGQFYPTSNPSGFITSFSAGVSVTGLSVTGFRSQTGLINISGQGSVTVSTGIGNFIIISGSNTVNQNEINILSGNLQSTGQNILQIINNLSGYYNTNPSGFITGVNTGNFIYTNLTGQFYPSSNPQNYVTSGNLQNTGQTLDNKINNLSGWANNISRVSAINVTGFGNQTGIINLSGLGEVTVHTGINNFIYISGSHNYSDGINLSGNLTSTGQTLYNYIIDTSGNLNNRLYQTGQTLIGLINSSAGGVSSLNNASGILSITGTGTVMVISGGVGLVYISGNNNDGINLSGNLQSTGQTLYNYIINASGNLDSRIYQSGSYIYNLLNNFSGVFNSSGTQYQNQIDYIESITGDFLFGYNTGDISNGQLLIGASGTNSFEQGNLYSNTGIIVVSGSGSLIINVDTGIISSVSALNNTGNSLNSKISIFSGNSQNFSTNISSTGYDNYIVSFPLLFPIIPKIQTTIEISGNNLYSFCISGRTTGNYTILFSDIISDSGVVVHTYATINY